MTDFEKLLELTDLLLERAGFTAYDKIDEDEMDEGEWAARTGGIEAWSVQFSALTYVLFPEDMQEMLREMACIVHEYRQDELGVEFTLDEEN
jgi:hypothetical protein